MRKVLLIVLLTMWLTPSAMGQGCAMCTKTAAGLNDKSAKGLNGGILYLAMLPLGILSTLGFVWWRHYKKEI